MERSQIHGDKTLGLLPALAVLCRCFRKITKIIPVLPPIDLLRFKRIAARNKAYDLILLDVMLPERRGTEILEALRGDKEDLIPNTRVLILTNFEQDDESRMAMEKRADGYLIKAEITPSKLLSVIAQLDQPTA